MAQTDPYPFVVEPIGGPALEEVLVEASAERRLEAPAPRQIHLYTPHDGAVIPPEFFYDPEGKPRLDVAKLADSFVEMRDWGANLVASELAAALGVKKFMRCRIARVLLDFNRFPGTTPKGANLPLEFYSISQTYGAVLKHSEKMELLQVYDDMSHVIEDSVRGSFLNIGVHTYDAHNPSATKRPDVSIVSTPQMYQRESRMPVGLFDPIYPDLLAESTCSRVLRDRISLNLERSGFRVSHNQPYPLPEGSIEVRSQVWFFFDYLRAQFQSAHPQTVDDDAFKLVWSMLLNTNHRDQEGEALSGYLHRYRRPRKLEKKAFEGARDAYAEVREFSRTQDVMAGFRRTPWRPSSMAIEVRKDLLVHFDKETGLPLPRTDAQLSTAKRIAELIASAIEIYLETDRQFGGEATL